MNKLKLYWLSPKVVFKGEGIADSWKRYMIKRGWQCVDQPADADLIFFGSDSQLQPVLVDMDKPKICYFWGWLHERMLDPNFQKFAQPQLDMMTKCTLVLVPSYITWYQACDLGLPSQICLPGIDTELIDSVHHNKPRENRVMFLSRIVPHKGLDILIQALSILKPSPRLLVVGPGDTKPYEELAKQLNVNATFTELDDKEKVIALKTSSLLVHPSTYEGFSLPPLESLYAGTPVVVTEIPQHIWLLRDSALYFYTPDGLAQQMANLLNNSQLAAELVRRGKQRIKEIFSLDKACERLEGFINMAVKQYVGQAIREHPERYESIYELEAKRNWAFGEAPRFTKDWARHWRSTWVLEELNKMDPKPETILDVGTGPVYPSIFTDHGFKVVALDISAEVLSQARLLAEKYKLSERINFIEGDAEALSNMFKPETFAACYLGEILEHCLHPVKVLEEAIKVCKPSAKLIITTPHLYEHNDTLHLRHWDLEEFQRTVLDLIKDKIEIEKLELIAETGREPSCIFCVLRKKGLI